MGEMWKADPRPLPDEGPAWPGDDERVAYKGLTVQPYADLEVWEARDDQWEIGLAHTGGVLIIIRAERDRALAIAARLADAKDWAALPETPSWVEIAFDPLVLRLIDEYPGLIALPELDAPDLDDIIPFGPYDGTGPNGWPG